MNPEATEDASADTDLVYGIHAVERLIDEEPRRVRILWLADTRAPRLGALFERARAAGVRVDVVGRRQLDRRAKGAHQGVVAQCHAATLATEEDFEDRFRSLPAPVLLLVLDGVQDPRNLGACLRSAEAAGVGAVLLPKRRSAPVSAVARKAASGAAEALFLVEVTNLARRLDWLKAEGVHVVGAAGDSSVAWTEADFSRPVAVVVGGEEKGMRALTREKCDALVSIPMLGKVASLNVSVATGVLLFEAVRQRRA